VIVDGRWMPSPSPPPAKGVTFGFAPLSTSLTEEQHFSSPASALRSWSVADRMCLEGAQCARQMARPRIPTRRPPRTNGVVGGGSGTRGSLAWRSRLTTRELCSSAVWPARSVWTGGLRLAGVSGWFWHLRRHLSGDQLLVRHEVRPARSRRHSKWPPLLEGHVLLTLEVVIN
jgi:hypothetical protein